jgi:hypothetical protein
LVKGKKKPALISATFNFRHDKVQTCKYPDNDFQKHLIALVGFFNRISKSKFELTQYCRLKDISMLKVKIPQENGWIFYPSKFLTISYGRKKSRQDKESHTI